MTTNAYMKLIYILFGVFCLMNLTPSSALAQDIVHVFPADGDTIRFQDLVGRGFEWTGPADAVKFQIRLFGPDPFLSQVPFEAESSPLKIQAIMERYFPDGADFQWRVEQVNLDGDVIYSTDTTSFHISNDTSLIPTPTPAIWPTPSGDIDGSSRIDAPDIFILASSWILSDGSLRGGDLNQDSSIDRNDLLFYIERFGSPAEPSPPSAPVGLPRNIQFTPYQEVTISETPLFEIQWTPPAYPQSENIVYDLMIARPDAKKIEVKGLETASFKPFQSIITLTGPYLVFIQARIEGVGSSDIASGQFEIVLFRQTVPTPTPVPQTSDISGDNTTNALDVVSFLKTFNTYKGHVKFNTLADLKTDEKIDRNDLLLFQQYYKDRDRGMAAPQWLTADVPAIVGGMPDHYNTVALTAPYELYLGQPDPKLGLAESYYLRLTFSAIDEAVDYFVSIHYEKRDVRLDFFTGGETTFTEKIIPLGHDDVVAVEVQAAGEGLQLGERSETLRVIIPPN